MRCGRGRDRSGGGQEEPGGSPSMARPRPAASSSSQSGREEWRIRLLKRAGAHRDLIQGSPCERPPQYRLQPTAGSNSGFSGVLTIAGFINQNMCRGSESSTLPHGWTRQRCVEDPHTLHRHLLRLNFLDNTWPQAPSIADCPQILQRKTEELVMATKRLKYLHEAKTSTRMTLVLDPRAVVKEPFCWHFLSRHY
ncbi:uncharacterized protein [Triticum aestivum]|uniref:uncharacterized protein isoform X2 n=1 Tax=Triticum aestivum TaxID=4565 RepID=UPI001D02EAF4|nr:uncharacterized protein LOC123137632 isoform X2 [Triticum aestivum]